MTNATMLKNEMARKGYTTESLAKKMDISSSRLRRKIRAQQEFKASEIMFIAELLELTDAKKTEIFFGMFENN